MDVATGVAIDWRQFDSQPMVGRSAFTGDELPQCVLVDGDVADTHLADDSQVPQ